MVLIIPHPLDSHWHSQTFWKYLTWLRGQAILGANLLPFDLTRQVNRSARACNISLNHMSNKPGSKSKVLYENWKYIYFSAFVGLCMVKVFLPSTYTLRVTRPSYKNISQILELHDPHFIPTCFGFNIKFIFANYKACLTFLFNNSPSNH